MRRAGRDIKLAIHAVIGFGRLNGNRDRRIERDESPKSQPIDLKQRAERVEFLPADSESSAAT